MISNRLITKGLSSSTRTTLVTIGFVTGIIEEIVEVGRQIIRHGRSSYKYWQDKAEEFVVFAKLVRYNDIEPDEPIKGWTRVVYDKTRQFVSKANIVTQRALRSFLDEIKVGVRLIR